MEDRVEEMKRALAEDKARRQQACHDEIAVILDKYNCMLEAYCVLKVGKVDVNIAVVAKE